MGRARVGRSRNATISPEVSCFFLRWFDAVVRPTIVLTDTGLPPRPGTCLHACLPCRATAQGSSMGCRQPVAGRGLVVHIYRARLGDAGAARRAAEAAAHTYKSARMVEW